ncbi:hypothetical protein DL771_006755 [Monosporascus sp. 5C6A]|nr:hypothetical protein DL771_006755 [Monosporascus sp. 5C6A]
MYANSKLDAVERAAVPASPKLSMAERRRSHRHHALGEGVPPSSSWPRAASQYAFLSLGLCPREHGNLLEERQN